MFRVKIWIRVDKELRVLVLVVFNINLIVSTVCLREVIRLTVRVANVSVNAVVVNVIKTGSVVHHHDNSQKRHWHEEETHQPFLKSKSHMRWQMDFIVAIGLK